MSVAMGLTGPEAPGPDRYVTLLPQLLDPERFPALLAASPAITDENDDEDFYLDEMRFGLDLILDGIESLTRASPASNPE
jgi:hypothetical protein